MQITIAERLKPFDHNPGTTCPLPGSTFALQIFPALICLYDDTKKLIAKITTNIQGPVLQFTVQLDLEKGNIVVFGQSSVGYFRYRLIATLDGKSLKIDVERQPTQNLLFTTDFKLAAENDILFKPFALSRLSLGCNKAQDWTLIKRRFCMKEILPIWHRLGQMIALPPITSPLQHLELKDLKTLFLAGFKSLMTPRLFDDEYQGIDCPIQLQVTSPLQLLSKGSKLITSMFASFDSKTLTVLTKLPAEFHSGRLLHFRCENIGLLDLEWSKKTIRRMILFAESDALIDLKFQNEIKSYRLREESDSKPKKIVASEQLNIEKGKTYYFDCFMK